MLEKERDRVGTSKKSAACVTAPTPAASSPPATYASVVGGAGSKQPLQVCFTGMAAPQGTSMLARVDYGDLIGMSDDEQELGATAIDDARDTMTSSIPTSTSLSI